jgi:hypothetical protein
MKRVKIKTKRTLDIPKVPEGIPGSSFHVYNIGECAGTLPARILYLCKVYCIGDPRTIIKYNNNNNK